MKMLTDKLTREQQQELLGTLFGFEFVDTGDGHWVLHDENGDRFYHHIESYQFDFSTLAGIFSYTAYRSRNQGHSNCQSEMRKVLGIK